MIPSDVFRLILTWIAFFHFISLVYVMSKTKYNRRCVLDHIYKSLFWPLLMDCFELQREQNIFRIFWEGNLNLWRKINSTDGAKSEHCYALCSRIRLRLELKMWNFNVQIIIAAWISDFKIHCQIVNNNVELFWNYSLPGLTFDPWPKLYFDLNLRLTTQF